MVCDVDQQRQHSRAKAMNEALWRHWSLTPHAGEGLQHSVLSLVEPSGIEPLTS